ncbi:VanW family protein [Dehalobacterium formicoaceticum]|uniref:VanW family protein n=1 Tax=Dehalobacterium formicoaceticum TaxID=51515 RepID=A0ABT1Y7B7_9FIRM|nr:VanW family protein [Dehalobacterium formicoaceticum]MCR6546779.1 VanW family protein [Dehalobacterium formicoaceticum]
MSKDQQKAKITLGICLLLILFAVLFYEFQVMHSNKILPGVTIAGMESDNMERNPSQLSLDPIYEQAMARKIIIQGADESWSYSPQKLGLKEDSAATIRDAWSIGRVGPFWKRWFTRWETKQNGITIPLAFQLDDQVLQQEVEKMAQTIDHEGASAELTIDQDHRIGIKAEQPGIQVHVEQSKDKIKEVLRSGDQTVVSLIIQTVEPEITEETVLSWQINGVVASFETFFNAAQEERSSNIKTAAQALDQVLLMPQEVFSFNEIVGRRTSETGYKESLVIENNEFISGVGGGVCQVSSTLYNVILLANLPILERHPHSLPVTYVEPGRDATVSYDWADLKFLNNRQKPVLLHTEYTKGKLKIYLFATKGDFQEVRLFSEIIEYLEGEEEIIHDKTLGPEQVIVEKKGQKGMVVDLYREFLASDGSLISREKITRDRYRAQKAVIRVPADQ